MASLKSYGETSTSFSCRVILLDTSYERDDRTVQWYLNGQVYASTTLDAAVAYGGDMTFTDLQPQTSYLVEAEIAYTEADERLTVTLALTATTLSARPSNFHWVYPKEAGKPFRLLADEWNALGRTVNAMRVYRGLTERSFTVAVGGQTFTAAQFNEIRNAIAALGTGIALPSASCGHPVTAEALNTLVTAVNAVE